MAGETNLSRRLESAKSGGAIDCYVAVACVVVEFPIDFNGWSWNALETVEVFIQRDFGLFEVVVLLQLLVSLHVGDTEFCVARKCWWWLALQKFQCLVTSILGRECCKRHFGCCSFVVRSFENGVDVSRVECRVDAVQIIFDHLLTCRRVISFRKADENN